MSALSTEEMDVIRRRHRNAAPHLKERATWQDIDSLLLEYDRLQSVVADYRGALEPFVKTDWDFKADNPPVARTVTGGDVAHAHAVYLGHRQNSVAVTPG